MRQFLIKSVLLTQEWTTFKKWNTHFKHLMHIGQVWSSVVFMASVVPVLRKITLTYGTLVFGPTYDMHV